MSMFEVGFALGVIAGGATAWFAKDRLLAWYHGADAFAKSLEAKAATIKGAL
ncbi:MAG: hypothetical protein ACREDL_01835 [Bradyrhizobium sp.]